MYNKIIYKNSGKYTKQHIIFFNRIGKRFLTATAVIHTQFFIKKSDIISLLERREVFSSKIIFLKKVINYFKIKKLLKLI